MKLGFNGIIHSSQQSQNITNFKMT